MAAAGLMRSLRRRFLLASIVHAALAPGLACAAATACALVGPGCGSSDSRTAPAADAGRARAVAPTPPAPPFAAEVRSLRLKRSISVRLEPSEDAQRIGTVAQDTRVGWTRVTTGPGCKQRWVEIDPHGWVCESYLEPSTQAPAGIELPRLPLAELVPGVYGKVHTEGATTWIENPALKAKPKPAAKKKAAAAVRGKATTKGNAPAVAPPSDQPDKRTANLSKLVKGTPLATSAHVRRWEVVEIEGRTYWRIAPAERIYVLAKDVHLHTPSPYHGERLGDDAPLGLPIAIAKQVAKTHAAAADGAVVGKLAARQVVAVREVARDAAGAATGYRIGESEWVSARDALLVEPATPPPGLVAGERWIDIDLDQQVVVAYEGELAVYATLVSSGGKATPTETGIYRIWMKFAETDMNGLAAEGGGETYEVSTVPWTQFFFKDLALHTAYWHDRFGTSRSHGCVNLAPSDARVLYFWTDPQVPPGWTMAAGSGEVPGSMVRVRSAADPSPEPKGYAKDLADRRAAQARR